MRYEHDHEKDIIYFAKTNFRNSLRKFGIKTDDRRRHIYVLGKTGMGKTTLLENMLLSDIYAGHGCCYIDPHGDTAEKIIDYIPSWRINDVVYFNPSDLEHPVGFNILESVNDDLKHLVAAGMMSVFKKIWENVWSARMEYILNNTILALLDNPGSTLLGINRMLSDKEHRKQIVSNIKDPIVKQFWIKEFEGYESKFASEAVAPIQNKVGQFLSAAIIRNIVAQSKSTINIRKIMDDQLIFIVNLSKGRIGEDASRLLGGMIITKIQMSAMERVEIPEADRIDFYMYVDEFQNFAVESFASILSEARKYRLNLIMAHQYIAQLTEEVRDAVFGNVGSMITFRMGSQDALFLENEFIPRLTPEDLINLPKFGIYIKLMIDGVTSMPFSALTLPPIAHRTESAERVIQQSRERYSGSRKDIEEHVSIWSGFGDDVDIEQAYKEVKDTKKAAKKARFSHEYKCTRCAKNFMLPVELDRSRPIYCEECMPIIQEERKKGKKPDRSSRGGGDRGGRKDKGGQNSGNHRHAQKEVPKPPKVSDGEILEKKTVEKEVSLSALSTSSSDAQKSKSNSRVEKREQRNDRKERPAREERQEPAVTMKQAVAEAPKEKKQDDKKTGVQEKKPSQDRSPRKRNRRRRSRGGGSDRGRGGSSRDSSASGGNKVKPPPADPVKPAQQNKVRPGQIISFDE